MPKYHPNNRFSDCYASVGNITFYHRDGECYYRAKANPTFPETPGQQEQLSLHRRAIKAWRELSHDTQLQWNVLAKDVQSKRPPFNTNNHISGYNLFVSAYHGLASTGNERPPLPAPIPTFPQLHLEFSSIKISSTNEIELTYIANHPIETFHVLSLIGKLQITKPGYRPHTGKYRSYSPTLTPSDNQTLVTFTIPNSEELDLTTCSIHLKYFLIDNTTGYRTKEHYQATLIQSNNT